MSHFKLNRSLFLLIFSMTVGLISCDDSSEAGFSGQTDVETETNVESYYEDVDDLTHLVSNFSDGSFSGRSSGLDDRLCDGASLELIRANSNDADTVRIDFGVTGCTDPRGITRKGTLLVIFTGDRKSSRSVVFEDFYLNGVKIEGTRTVTRTTFLPPTFTFTLEDGKVIWPDGTTAEREASGTRVFYRNGSDPSLDSMVLKSGGSASGVNRKGKTYSMSISKDIVFKRSCMEGPKRIFIPVSGIKSVTVDSRNISVDFGDGTCDDLVTLTVDGVSKEVPLRRDGN